MVSVGPGALRTRGLLAFPLSLHGPLKLKLKSTKMKQKFGSSGETGSFGGCWWGCKIAQPLWRTAQNLESHQEVNEAQADGMAHC